MPDNGFEKMWIERGILIANGGKIGLSDLYAIYDNVDVSQIFSVYLNENITRFTRAEYLFDLSRTYWGLTETDWIRKETDRVDEAIKVRGYRPISSGLWSGIASVEILFNFIFASKIVTEDKEDRELSWEAVNSINLTVGELCSQGRNRTMKVKDQYISDHFRNGGLLTGMGNKSLPFPEKSLPELLLMLNRDKINQKIYKDSFEKTQPTQ